MTDHSEWRGAPLYRMMAPDLPDIGWNRVVPKPLSQTAVRAIHASTDVPSLGVMLGELRAYWAATGGVALALFGGLAAGAAGFPTASAVFFAMGVPAALVTIEARRRARVWQATIEARLGALQSAP